MDTLELAEQIYRADFAPLHVKPWRTLDAVTRSAYRKRAESVDIVTEDRRAEFMADGERACSEGGHDGAEQEAEDARRDEQSANDYIELLEEILAERDIPFPKDPR